jgi:hypothetical protein
MVLQVVQVELKDTGVGQLLQVLRLIIVVRLEKVVVLLVVKEGTQLEPIQAQEEEVLVQ